MQKLYFILIIIVVVSCKSSYTKIGDKNANYIPYYLKVYEADSLFVVKNYSNSYEILDSLFKKFEPINLTETNEYLYYIKLSIKLKKKINKENVFKLYNKYGYSDELIEYDEDLKFYNNSNGNILNINFKNSRKAYLNSINLSLRDSINIMKIKDQKYRNKDYNKNIKFQDSIDKQNEKILANYFDKNLFPNEKLFGGFSIDNKSINIGSLLLHTKDSIRKKYFMPKTLEFIKKGEALPRYYGNMTDQNLLYNGFEQKYGTYNTQSLKNSKLTKKEFNKNRKTIGLPSIEYVLWKDSIAKSMY